MTPPSPLGQISWLRRSIAKHGLHGAVARATPRARDAYVRTRRLASPLRHRTRRAAVTALGGKTEHELDPEVGFRIVPPGSIDGVAEVVDLANHVVEGTPPERLHGPHVTGLLSEAELTSDSPLLRLALSRMLVGPAARYLGMVPVLRTLDVWYSQHADDDEAGSQLYHLDGDDTIQVKVFVHCSDVDETSGPLTLIDSHTSARIRGGISYLYARPRVPDSEIQRLRGDAGEQPLIGPVGTVAFADTSRCFHFGSRLEPGAKPRLLAMFQYVTPVAFTLPGDYRTSAPYRHLASESSSELERLVLGAE